MMTPTNPSKETHFRLGFVPSELIHVNQHMIAITLKHINIQKKISERNKKTNKQKKQWKPHANKSGTKNTVKDSS